jgi:hypothetical protein
MVLDNHVFFIFPPNVYIRKHPLYTIVYTYPNSRFVMSVLVLDAGNSIIKPKLPDVKTGKCLFLMRCGSWQ